MYVSEYISGHFGIHLNPSMPNSSLYITGEYISVYMAIHYNPSMSKSRSMSKSQD